MQIRAAQTDEAEALTALCRAAKRHWGYPAAWMEVWADDLRLTVDYLACEPVGVGVVAGRGVGFFGLRSEPGRWHLEHLWVEPAEIGRGYGRQLFAAAVAAARHRGVLELHIKSDPHAEPFYLRLGAVRRALQVYELLGTRREVPLLVYAVPPADRAPGGS